MAKGVLSYQKLQPAPRRRMRHVVSDQLAGVARVKIDHGGRARAERRDSPARERRLGILGGATREYSSMAAAV